MTSRVLAMLVAAGAFFAFTVGAGTAAARSVTGTCPSGEMCVWSGTNYTGGMAVVPQDDWFGCVTAGELGLSAIRSASRQGVPCHLQASLHADTVCGRPTDPSYVEPQTPTISPAALSLDRFQIPC